MSTTELPPGIYRISAARSEGLEPEYLTQEEWVTVAPPGAQDDPKQEVSRLSNQTPLSVAHQHFQWLVEKGKDSKDGNIVIGRVSKFFPSPFLSYQNNNEEAKPGDRVVVSLSDLPANEWSLVKASEYPHCYLSV